MLCLVAQTLLPIFGMYYIAFFDFFALIAFYISIHNKNLSSIIMLFLCSFISDILHGLYCCTTSVIYIVMILLYDKLKLFFDIHYGKSLVIIYFITYISGTLLSLIVYNYMLSWSSIITAPTVLVIILNCTAYLFFKKLGLYEK